MTRFHPLTGELAPNGISRNGSSRPEVAAYFHSNRLSNRARLSYDAARDGTDLDNHWAFADALDADSANSRTVRHKLIKRSRYEQGSNGYYEGAIVKHVNRLVGGTGPMLRMLSGSRTFNQTAEREFYRWAQAVGLRRKLWAMAHARYGDGETFALLQTNPQVRHSVQLDFVPFEAEQCQSLFIPLNDKWYIDGIKRDIYDNVLWYDILPTHPGSQFRFLYADPERVSPANVLHWFKLIRPGAGRGRPDLTSTLNVGASSRRHREATVAAAETAADLAALIQTTLSPNGEAEAVAPFTTVDSEKRQLMMLPMGWTAQQMRGEHPNAQYAEFHRLQNSEMTAPLAQPVNVTTGDSSNYSFASGKLDTLFYREMIDIERADCNELILDRLFAAWFREWTVLADRRDIPPDHQWDWPQHPVIDAVAENTATDIKLKNGTISLRQVYSDAGKDLEDELAVMAEDTFGEATDETIEKTRKMLVLKNTPSHAIQCVAQLLGIETPETQQPTSQPEEQYEPAV